MCVREREREREGEREREREREREGEEREGDNINKLVLQCWTYINICAYVNVTRTYIIVT